MTLKRKAIVIFTVLLLGIFLTGCFNSNSIVIEKGNLLLYIKKSEPITEQIIPQYIPSESTHVQLRIFNESQEILRNVEIPESGVVPVEINLPVGFYELQAIAYTGSEALTMGSLTGIEVKANEYTQANLTLERPTYGVETYVYDESGNKVIIDTLEGGQSFYISYTIDTKGLTFDWFDKIHTYLNGEENFDALMYFDSEVQLTAPSVETESILSMKIEIVAPDDIYGSFYHIYLPSSTLNETAVELTVTPAEGGIVVGID